MSAPDASPTARLRELAYDGARLRHFGAVDREHDHADFETCPHPDCVLVRTEAALAAGSAAGIADCNDRASGEAAYCHHRHHMEEHSTNFDTCPHPICVNARLLAGPASGAPPERQEDKDHQSRVAPLGAGSAPQGSTASGNEPSPSPAPEQVKRLQHWTHCNEFGYATRVGEGMCHCGGVEVSEPQNAGAASGAPPSIPRANWAEHLDELNARNAASGAPRSISADDLIQPHEFKGVTFERGEWICACGYGANDSLHDVEPEAASGAPPEQDLQPHRSSEC